MAEPVAEMPLEVARFDDVSRERVRIDPADARTQPVERGLLRGEHDVVRLAHLAVDAADRERARVIGGVSVDRAACVDDHELALAHHAVAGTRVRARAGRPSADDEVERYVLGALVVEDLLQLPRDLALGAAAELHLREALVRAVRDRARLAERRQLTLVLDRTELLDRRLGLRQLDAGGAQPLEQDIRQHPFEGDTLAAEQLAERADRVALRLDRLDVSDLARRLDVAEVGEQADAVALDEQRAIRAVEADEVLDVH